MQARNSATHAHQTAPVARQFCHLSLMLRAMRTAVVPKPHWYTCWGSPATPRNEMQGTSTPLRRHRRQEDFVVSRRRQHCNLARTQQLTGRYQQESYRSHPAFGCRIAGCSGRSLLGSSIRQLSGTPGWPPRLAPPLQSKPARPAYSTFSMCTQYSCKALLQLSAKIRPTRCSI